MESFRQAGREYDHDMPSAPFDERVFAPATGSWRVFLWSFLHLFLPPQLITTLILLLIYAGSIWAFIQTPGTGPLYGTGVATAGMVFIWLHFYLVARANWRAVEVVVTPEAIALRPKSPGEDGRVCDPRTAMRVAYHRIYGSLSAWLRPEIGVIQLAAIERVRPLASGMLLVEEDREEKMFIPPFFDVREIQKRLQKLRVDAGDTASRPPRMIAGSAPEEGISASPVDSPGDIEATLRTSLSLLVVAVVLVVAFAPLWGSLMYYSFDWISQTAAFLMAVVLIGSLPVLGWHYIGGLQECLASAPMDLVWNEDYLGLGYDGEFENSVVLVFEESGGLFGRLAFGNRKLHALTWECFDHEDYEFRKYPAPLIPREKITAVHQDRYFLMVFTGLSHYKFPRIPDDDFERLREWALGDPEARGGP